MILPAIYVHSSSGIPYAEAIVRGAKPIETRSRDVLARFVGQRVLIIRTRNGKPSDVVGSAIISRKDFHTVQELDAMRDQTLIPPGSKFDCHGRGKWCYTMKLSMAYEKPVPLSAYTIISRTRSWAMLEEQEIKGGFNHDQRQE